MDIPQLGEMGDYFSNSLILNIPCSRFGECAAWLIDRLWMPTLKQVFFNCWVRHVWLLKSIDE